MNQAQSFVHSSGFKQHQNLAYGRADGIFYCVQFVNMGVAAKVTAFVCKPEGIFKDEIERFIEAEGRKYKAQLAIVEGNAVTVVLNSLTWVKAQTVSDFLAEFSAFLNSRGYSSSCTACGAKEGLINVLRNDVVKEVCESCYEALCTSTEQIKQHRAATGSYLTGAIGAVLGGLIGIFAWVAFAFIGFISALSGLIMAYLSFKFYQLFKGKQAKGMLFIIIAVLIVFTYFGVIASQIVIERDYLESIGMNAFDSFVFLSSVPFVLPFEYTAELWGQI